MNKQYGEKIRNTASTKFALPAIGVALAMLGFNLAGVIALNSVIFATILTMGFIAPLLGGLLEYSRGNSYRATTYILFSLMFLTFYLFSTADLGGITADPDSIGIFFLIWTVIAAGILCATFFLKMGVKMIMLQVILAAFLLFTLFLAIAAFTQVDALFITSGVFTLISALAIFVDFIYHICMRMKEDMPVRS